MIDYPAKAKENFLRGYNCAQSVLLAFARDVGLAEEQALKLSSSFGAGIGRLREVCGALSALMMVEGLLEGYVTPDDIEGKAAQYARVQILAGRFQAEMGSILCRELLGDEASTSPTPAARTEQYYASRPCCHAIECAARLGQELLPRKFQKN